MRHQQLLLFPSFYIFDDNSITFYSDYPFELQIISSIDFSNKLEYCNSKYYKTLSTNTTVDSGKLDDKYYIKLRGNNISYFANSTENYSYFVLTSENNIYCTGNILNLLNYKNKDSIVLPDYCFYKLFQNCKNLVSSPSLPSTTVSKYCYSYMFYKCTSLIETPELPANSLDIGCYMDMFNGCTTIRKPTKLYATNLPEQCYKNMFYNCTNIYLYKDTVFPDIYKVPYSNSSESSSATSLENMFYGTSGEIKGTIETNTIYYYDTAGGIDKTISVQFYNNSQEPFTFSVSNTYYNENNIKNTIDENIKIYYSFDNINFTEYSYNTKITTDGPNLYLQGRKNTELGPIGIITFYSGNISCIGNLIKLIDYTINTSQSYDLDYSKYQFSSLFYKNTYIKDISLLTIPPLSSKISISSAPFAYMFYGCSGLTSDKLIKSIPNASARTYACYKMFSNCTSLTYIPFSLPSAYDHGYDNMFSGCTNLISIPENFIPECYPYECANMFSGCTSLTSIPENIFSNVISTQINYNVFDSMFKNCTSLTSIPDNIFSFMESFSVTSYSRRVFNNMFSGCTSLTSIGNIFPSNMTSAERFAFYGMFQGCTSLTTIPIDLLKYITYAESDKESYSSQFNDMFYNCIKLEKPCHLYIQTIDNLYHISIANNMFRNTAVKISEVKNNDYTELYRIPQEGTLDTYGIETLFTDMFEGTAGPFVGSPEANKDYWLYSPITPTKYKTELYSPIDINESTIFRAWKSCYYQKETTTIDVEVGSKTYPQYQKINTKTVNNINYNQKDNAWTATKYTEYKDNVGTITYYAPDGEQRSYYKQGETTSETTTYNKWLSSAGVFYDNVEDVPTSIAYDDTTTESKEIVYINRVFTDEIVFYTMELPDTYSYNPNTYLKFSTYTTAENLSFPLVITENNKYYTGMSTYESYDILNVAKEEKIIITNPQSEVKYSALQQPKLYNITINKSSFTYSEVVDNVYVDSYPGIQSTYEELYIGTEKTVRGYTYIDTENSKGVLLTSSPTDVTPDVLFTSILQYLPKDPYISDTSLYVDPGNFDRVPIKSSDGSGAISISYSNISGEETYKPFVKYSREMKDYSLTIQNTEFSSENSGTHIVGICVKDSDGKMRLVCNVSTTKEEDGTYIRTFAPAKVIEKYKSKTLYMSKTSYKFLSGKNTDSFINEYSGTFCRVPDLDESTTLDGVYYQEYESPLTSDTETKYIHYGNNISELNTVVNAIEIS